MLYCKNDVNQHIHSLEFWGRTGTSMKTLYIFLTRSGTLVSNLVYALTGAEYTHISLAFDEDLTTLYSSTRKNGYTMFPAGPSREYLNRGVFRLRENIPCALYALETNY